MTLRHPVRILSQKFSYRKVFLSIGYVDIHHKMVYLYVIVWCLSTYPITMEYVYVWSMSTYGVSLRMEYVDVWSMSVYVSYSYGVCLRILSQKFSYRKTHIAKVWQYVCLWGGYGQ